MGRGSRGKAVAERESRWVGRVAPGAEAEHAAFVAGLEAPEVERAFRANGVTRYELIQAGDRLQVVFRARSPADAVKFLRYKRLWPEFWVWESADAEHFPAGETRFLWARDI